MSAHGLPCWYELATPDKGRSERFYASALGWEFSDAPMPGFQYALGKLGADVVAGVFDPGSPMPSFWLIYFAVDDCDAAVKKAVGLGAAVHVEPTDIPQTGRFAILADPQGAAFALLQPLDGQTGTAYQPMRAGYGCWHQLETADTKAALSFYASLLGWSQSTTHDMGEMGPYRVVAVDGADLGGIMKPFAAGSPARWLPFFGADSVAQALDRVRGASGKVISGPDPVPGGAFVATVTDDQGIAFALVGGA